MFSVSTGNLLNAAAVLGPDDGGSKSPHAGTSAREMEHCNRNHGDFPLPGFSSNQEGISNKMRMDGGKRPRLTMSPGALSYSTSRQGCRVSCSSVSVRVLSGLGKTESQVPSEKLCPIGLLGL